MKSRVSDKSVFKDVFKGVFDEAILSRYIMRRIIAALLMTFLNVISITVLVDFVEGNRNYADNENMNAVDVAVLTLLKAPKLIEETIPFIVLFGVMGALNGLNKHHELVVMRSIGLSAWRFLKPIIFVTSSVGVMWALLFNPAASRLTAEHQRLKESFNTKTQTTAPLTGKTIWLREGNEISQTVIRATRANPQTLTLYDVTFYQLSLETASRTAFSRRYDAKTATLEPQNYWQLKEVIENAPEELKKEHDALSLPTLMSSEQFETIGEKAVTPAFWSLPQEIKNQKDAGFSTLALRMQFHKLLALPVLLIAMTFIAACVTMNLSRSGGTLRLLVLGSVFGFAVYFGNSVMHTFGEAGTLPVILSAWFTPLLIIFLGISYLSKIEDG